MRAIVCEALGDATQPLGHGVLKLVADFPQATLGERDVRIKVVAASLNFPDALQIKGEYQVRPKLPFVPGSEVSGEVLEVGRAVKRFKAGDKVCAVKQGAPLRTMRWCPQQQSGRYPTALIWSSASAVPIAFGTADLALRHRAQLKAGQTVLVLGAAGGVGTAAVQISKLVGAKVVAVVTGHDKAEFVRGLGADAVIDGTQASKEAPLSKLIRKACPAGVDVVFDPVGGPALPEALKSVRWGAHYLVIGFASGGIPSIPANHLLVKNTTVHGIFWGSYMQQQPDVLLESMRQVLTWLAAGQLRVHVSHRFPMERVDEAFRALLERRVLGKVVITMAEQQATQQRSRL